MTLYQTCVEAAPIFRYVKESQAWKQNVAVHPISFVWTISRVYFEIHGDTWETNRDFSNFLVAVSLRSIWIILWTNRVCVPLLEFVRRSRNLQRTRRKSGCFCCCVLALLFHFLTLPRSSVLLFVASSSSPTPVTHVIAVVPSVFPVLYSRTLGLLHPWNRRIPMHACSIAQSLWTGFLDSLVWQQKSFRYLGIQQMRIAPSERKM
jgi:hypothetical protein